MSKPVTPIKPDTALRKLRTQITLLSTAISAAVLLAIVLTALFLTEMQFELSSKRYLSGSLNSVVARLQSESVVSHTWMAQVETSDNMILSIYDGNQPLHFSGSWTPKTDREILLERAKLQAQSQGLSLDRRPVSLFHVPTVLFTIYGDHGEQYLGGAAVIPGDRSWQSVILLRDQSSDQQRIWLLRGAFALLLLLGVALLWWLCWLSAGKTIRPISESRKKQVEFIAAASHELRSPLAVIQTSSAALGSSPDTDATLRNAIQRECIRMRRLIDDLLTLARGDAGNWSVTMLPTDIDTLLLEVTDKFIPIAGQKNQTLHLQVPDETLPLINGDAQRLEQLLTILLDNACSYTPSGGNITLSATFNRNKLFLKVADDGPGIPPEHRSQIFDRFYRGDSARTQKDHYGLGLSIAKELASLHGGKLYLENNSSSGAVFVLELPRRPHRFS